MTDFATGLMQGFQIHQMRQSLSMERELLQHRRDTLAEQQRQFQMQFGQQAKELQLRSDIFEKIHLPEADRAQKKFAAEEPHLEDMLKSSIAATQAGAIRDEATANAIALDTTIKEDLYLGSKDAELQAHQSKLNEQTVTSLRNSVLAVRDSFEAIGTMVDSKEREGTLDTLEKVADMQNMPFIKDVVSKMRELKIRPTMGNFMDIALASAAPKDVTALGVAFKGTIETKPDGSDRLRQTAAEMIYKDRTGVITMFKDAGLDMEDFSPEQQIDLLVGWISGIPFEELPSNVQSSFVKAEVERMTEEPTEERGLIGRVWDAAWDKTPTTKAAPKAPQKVETAPQAQQAIQGYKDKVSPQVWSVVERVIEEAKGDPKELKGILEQLRKEYDK